MDLLSPKNVGTQKQASTTEAEARNRALAIEESRLTKKVNEARQKATEFFESTDEDFKAYKIQKEKEKLEIQSEIDSLKKVWAELLRPIDEIKAEAEKILDGAKAYRADVDRQAQDLEKNRERNLELAEAIKDQEQELRRWETKIEIREKACKSEEARIRQSNLALAGEWANLHKATHQSNQYVERLAIREDQIEAEHQANEVRKKELDAVADKLRDDRRAITDGYENLAKARREILGRDT